MGFLVLNMQVSGYAPHNGSAVNDNRDTPLTISHMVGTAPHGLTVASRSLPTIDVGL